MTNQATVLRDAIQEGNAPLVSAIHDLIATIQSHPGTLAPTAPTIRPAWAPEEATSECDLTGWPVPPNEREKVGDYYLHPNVAGWLEAQGLTPDEGAEKEIPESLNSVPTIRVPASRARENIELRWNPEDLPRMKRTELYRAAAEVGLQPACKELGVDFRYEKSTWLVKAIRALSEGAPVPPPESARNLETYTGGTAAPEEPKPAPKKAKKSPSPASKARDRAAAKLAELPEGQITALRHLMEGVSVRKRDMERLQAKGFVTSTGKVKKPFQEALG